MYTQILEEIEKRIKESNEMYMKDLQERNYYEAKYCNGYFNALLRIKKFIEDLERKEIEKNGK